MAKSARAHSSTKKTSRDSRPAGLRPGARLGLWLIGAAGNVAATVAVGLAALRRGLAAPVGMVTADPAFAPLGLVDPADIVPGGHDVRSQGVLETARAMQAGSGVFGGGLLEAVRSDLAAFQKEIRAGFSTSPAGSQADRPSAGSTRSRLEAGATKHRSPSATRRGELGTSATLHRLETGSAEHRLQTGVTVIERLAGDIRNFAARNKCSRVVVINVASTEPLVEPRPEHRSWKALSAAMQKHSSSPNRPGDQASEGRYGAILPASSIYALAAIEAGCPYINFTPSTGVDIPAIVERAASRRVPIMGRDGKTGETLLKSALAPMFRHRGLRVLSWDGHNILGNNDGAVLSDPAVKAAKLQTKDSVAANALGYDVDTSVSIQHVPSLDDWKIAWDHVHFEGFLGVKMSLQFTWQGCDSILAAPLVIDLARLAEFHARTGQSDVMSHLACFFKRPMGCEEAGLPGQIDMLARYIAKNSKPPANHTRRGGRRS